MLRISALNDSSDSQEDEINTQLTKTKEAKEAEAFAAYNKALSYQHKGNVLHAEKLLRNLFDHPLLKEAAELVHEGSQLQIKSNSGLQLLYSVHKNLASILLQRKQLLEAMAAYAEAVKIDSTEVTVWFQMGQVARQLDNYPLAKICFQQALQCNPNHWPSLDNAITISYALGDYLLCLQNISLALAKDHDYPKGNVLRKKIFSEQPLLKLLTKDFFVHCTPEMNILAIDQEEKKEYINEALHIRSRRRQLAAEDKEKELKPVTFLNPLTPFTWKNVGEQLIKLYDFVTSNPASKSLALEVDLRDYFFLDQSVFFGQYEEQSKQPANFSSTESIAKKHSFQSQSNNSKVNELPILIQSNTKETALLKRLHGTDVGNCVAGKRTRLELLSHKESIFKDLEITDDSKFSSPADGLNKCSEISQVNDNEGNVKSSELMDETKVSEREGFKDLESIDATFEMPLLREEDMDIASLCDIQKNDFKEDVMATSDIKSLEKVLATVIDMEFGLQTDKNLTSDNKQETNNEIQLDFKLSTVPANVADNSFLTQQPQTCSPDPTFPASLTLKLGHRDCVQLPSGNLQATSPLLEPSKDSSQVMKNEASQSLPQISECNQSSVNTPALNEQPLLSLPTTSAEIFSQNKSVSFTAVKVTQSSSDVEVDRSSPAEVTGHVTKDLSETPIIASLFTLDHTTFYPQSASDCHNVLPSVHPNDSSSKDSALNGSVGNNDMNRCVASTNTNEHTSKECLTQTQKTSASEKTVIENLNGQNVDNLQQSVEVTTPVSMLESKSYCSESHLPALTITAQQSPPFFRHDLNSLTSSYVHDDPNMEYSSLSASLSLPSHHLNMLTALESEMLLKSSKDNYNAALTEWNKERLASSKKHPTLHQLPVLPRNYYGHSAEFIWPPLSPTVVSPRSLKGYSWPAGSSQSSINPLLTSPPRMFPRSVFPPHSPVHSEDFFTLNYALHNIGTSPYQQLTSHSLAHFDYTKLTSIRSAGQETASLRSPKSPVPGHQQHSPLSPSHSFPDHLKYPQGASVQLQNLARISQHSATSSITSYQIGDHSYQKKGLLFQVMLEPCLSTNTLSTTSAKIESMADQRKQSSGHVTKTPSGSKRGSKRKMEDPSFEEWAHDFKRRSTRSRSVKNQKDGKTVNYKKLMHSYFPLTLLNEVTTENADKADEVIMEVERSHSDQEDRLSTNVTLKKLTENEEEEVKTLIKNCLKHNSVIDLMYKYLLQLARKSDNVWYEGVVNIYLDLYKRLRKHFSPPSVFDEDCLSLEGLKNYATLILVLLELSLNKAMTELGFKTSMSPAKAGHLGDSVKNLLGDFHSEDMTFLSSVIGRSDALGPWFGHFCVRFYWLKAKEHHLFNETHYAVDCYEIAEELLQDLENESQEKDSVEAKMGMIYLPNLQDKVISLKEARRLLEALQRCKSLESNQKLYDEAKYQLVVNNLVASFSSNRAKSTKSLVEQERPVQLLLLVNSLYHLNKQEEGIYWAEVSLNEAVQCYKRVPSVQLHQEWAATLVTLFSCIDRLLEDNSNCLSFLSRQGLYRLADNLTSIIDISLDVADTVTEMPIASLLPWKILYRVLNYEEQLSKKMVQELEKEEDEDEMSRSLAMLIEAHEHLGRHSWCTRDNGALLLFTMSILEKDLDEKDREDLHFEQCVYCLYGHPNKKGKARHLNDHNATCINLTWEKAGVLFYYFAPKHIPEFDSYKIKSVTSDVENLLKRIYSLVPNELNPSGFLPTITDYIDGTSSSPPCSPTFSSHSKNDPYKICSNIYYLLGDFYFKSKEPAKAVKFYQLDLVINSNRLDSWAGLALAKMYQIEQKLNSTELKIEAPIAKKSEAALRCFKRAVELAKGSRKLWLEYGSLAYQLHSHASRQIKYQHLLSINPDITECSENHQKESLLLAKQNYLQARDCKGDGTEEDWLIHYMLGKIAEKQKESPEIYLEHYKQAALCLYHEEAVYPKKIQFASIPPHLALESLEVFYRLHVSSLKLMLNNPSNEHLTLILRYVQESLDSPFARCEEKHKSSDQDRDKLSTKPSTNQTLSKQKLIYHKNPIDHDYSKLNSSNISLSETCEANRNETRLNEIIDLNTLSSERSETLKHQPGPILKSDSINWVKSSDVLGQSGHMTCQQLLSDLIVSNIQSDSNSQNIQWDNSAQNIDGTNFSQNIHDKSNFQNNHCGSNSHQNIQGIGDSQNIQGSSNSQNIQCDSNVENIMCDNNSINIHNEINSENIQFNNQNLQLDQNSQFMQESTTQENVDKKLKPNDTVYTVDSCITEISNVHGYKCLTEMESSSYVSSILESKQSKESESTKPVLSLSESISENETSKLVSADLESKQPTESETTKFIVKSNESLHQPSTHSSNVSAAVQATFSETETVVLKNDLGSCTNHAKQLLAHHSIGGVTVTTPDKDTTKTEATIQGRIDGELNKTTTITAEDVNMSAEVNKTAMDKVSPEQPGDGEREIEGKLNEGEEKEPYLLTAEIIPQCVRGLQLCVEGLKLCAERYNAHYKSLYRLAYFHYRYKSFVKAKDILLGSPDWQDQDHMPTPGLFADRKQSNFFQGLWKIPIDDIDRSGSFASHVHRSVDLLLKILTDLGDLDMLKNMRNQLKRTPDTGKKFLRDAERLALAEEAYQQCLVVIQKEMESSEKWSESLRENNLNKVYQVWLMGKGSRFIKEANSELLRAFKIMMKGKTDVTRLNEEQAIIYCQTNLSKVTQPPVTIMPPNKQSTDKSKITQSASTPYMEKDPVSDGTSKLQLKDDLISTPNLGQDNVGFSQKEAVTVEGNIITDGNSKLATKSLPDQPSSTVQFTAIKNMDFSHKGELKHSENIQKEDHKVNEMGKTCVSYKSEHPGHGEPTEHADLTQRPCIPSVQGGSISHNVSTLPCAAQTSHLDEDDNVIVISE